MTTGVFRVTGLDELGSIYDDILDPSFPPDELSTREDFLAAAVEGREQAWVLFDDDRTAAGVAVVGTYGLPHVRLLSWLAVHPSKRASGMGGRLLASVLSALEADGVRLLLGEMEEPSGPAHPTHGDPARRAQFYRRFGAQVIDVPHETPPARPGLDTVPLLLFALPLPSHPLGETVESDGVLDLLRDYRGLKPTSAEYAELVACRVDESFAYLPWDSLDIVV